MRPNAIEPYVWVAEYRDGGRLRQFDVDGLHYAKEIDLARVSRLEIHGHPAGVLAVDSPVPPTAVVLVARNRIRMGAGKQERSRRILFGFQFGDQQAVWQIGENGEVGRFTGVV